jgi:hypothetical protein
MKTMSYKWEFKARFRRSAFGWKASRLAIERIGEAVSEIKSVARKDPVLAVEGAIAFIERVSPALEHVDSSSGVLGSAVNYALAELTAIIAAAPADAKTRDAWLARLWAAHEADQIPYIERLGDHWGDLCASEEVASAWADRLLDVTRAALRPDPKRHTFFHGTAGCLSALYRAGRYKEILKLLSADREIWDYKRWAVKALIAIGRKEEAIRYAEACRGLSTPDLGVDAICEEILLSLGRVDEAYERYGLRANQRGTYLATFRAVAKRYPHKTSNQILDDLVRTTPGEEGKWFAAAKEAGLYDEALALARSTPCDPKTLTRAARDLAERQPSFAVQVGLLAIHWLVEGYGYEVTGSDVWAAYTSTMKAAERNGTVLETREQIKETVCRERPNGFVTQILGRELEMNERAGASGAPESGKRSLRGH